ncbi:MAG: hypothetical protein LBV34_25460 [Nocardiopsaceae bacterium]|jgi:hypothetical protein|nr:hypothetical protein [Nocardiopsaceae bacterium]
MHEDTEPNSPGDNRRRAHSRDRGIRAARRTSSWTAAALIAGVAATTGYLAQSMPGTTTASNSSPGSTPAPASHANSQRHAGATKPRAPHVKTPVVTSGGSGAAGNAAGQVNTSRPGQPPATHSSSPRVKSPVATSGGSGATGGAGTGDD